MAELFAVYDLGALVAAERRDWTFRKLHQRLLGARVTPVVPLPVYAQAYRDDPRQHGLRVVMKHVMLHGGDQNVAELAGRALRATGTDDAVDAVVAATAVLLRAPVVTSDRGDMRKLLDGLSRPEHPILDA